MRTNEVFAVTIMTRLGMPSGMAELIDFCPYNYDMNDWSLLRVKYASNSGLTYGEVLINGDPVLIGAETDKALGRLKSPVTA